MKKKSLRLLTISMVCILILMPTVLAITYFCSGITRQMRTQATRSADFYLNQVLERTELLTDTLRNGIFCISSDEGLQALMRAPDLPTEMEQRRTEDEISRILMYDSAWSQNAINGCYIFKDDVRCFTMFRSNIYTGAAQRITKAYDRIKNSNSIRKISVYDDIPGYAYCAADYIDLDTMEPLGKIVFELIPQKFINIDYLTSLYPGAIALLRGSDGVPLYSSAAPPKTQALLSAIEDKESNAYCEADGELYLYVRQRSSSSPLYIDVVIPQRDIVSPIRMMSQLYLTVVLSGLLATLLIGWLVMARLLQPLRRMIASIDRLATGDLSVRMEPTPYRETERMVQAFNSMADRLNDLFGEVYDKGLLLKDAECRLLESQISPHFIFNILEVIHMRCILSGQNEVGSMVTNLAQLLRSNILHKDRQKVTITQELQYVRYYLALQKERFGEQLSYEILYEDDELLSYSLPKLTIQPLVENSIVHGIENKRGGGKVSVRLWEEPSVVCIQVVDDGAGFCTERITPHGVDGNHIALHNIERRIQLLYGKQYGLQINSKPGLGTSVLVTLPVDLEVSKGDAG